MSKKKGRKHVDQNFERFERRTERYTQGELDHAEELYNSGTSVDEIALILGCWPGTVYKWAKLYGWRDPDVLFLVRERLKKEFVMLRTRGWKVSEIWRNWYNLFAFNENENMQHPVTISTLYRWEKLRRELTPRKQTLKLVKGGKR